MTVNRSQIVADLLKAVLTIAGLAALVGVYWLWLIFCYDRPYHRIIREDSEAHVVVLLGKPYQISAPHNAIKENWSNEDGFGIAEREIVKQYRYRIPFITGDEYIIGFDSDGHAVLKTQLTSP